MAVMLPESFIWIMLLLNNASQKLKVMHNPTEMNQPFRHIHSTF